MRKVVLGLSGGVDSCVSAALLKREYEVVGLYLDTGSPGGAADARAAADALGLELYVRDVRAGLEALVCAPFAAGYLRGETPNPCVLCNPLVKFKNLLELADETGAEHIATGHYARAQGGRLYMGRPENDQSYMLCRVTAGQLDRLILPLGGFNKSEVRKIASEMGLPTAGKPASMEICFVPDGDYAAFIEARGVVPPPGDFISENGEILGKHKGIHHYTTGQRRGLGVSAGRRVFVSRIDPERNEVVLSDGSGLFAKTLRAVDTSWHGQAPDAPFRASVRIRHSKAIYPAAVTPYGHFAEVLFDEPVRAPAPGQAAVFYDGALVLGGGFIA